MHDKHQVTEEPCEFKGSCTVLQTSGAGDSLAEFNRSCHDAIKHIKNCLVSKPKYVLDADISQCFDSIHHEILLKILNQRIADSRLLQLIERFLKAGVMEGCLFKQTEFGTPQGGICSPLLANIYLHQLDLYWWNKYGNLNRKEKERRRLRHQGNCALIRYADDWLVLTNGGKTEAIRLRDEFRDFLREELKLELSESKTRITHVNDGFDFLGFHVQRYVSAHDRPKVLVTPAPENLKKLKLKIKEMTRRKRFQDSPLLKISALNAVLRGWINYYRHCNVKKIAKDLDFWVNQRLFLWLQKRQKLSPRRILKMYKHRENGKRYNLGIRNGDKYQFLYRMSDLSLTKYRSRSPENPYLDGEWITEVSLPESPIPKHTWNGNADNSQWRELKEEIKAERGSKCELCGSQENLDLHHVIARRKKGNDIKENLQLLCRSCHAQTPSYGRPKQQ